MQDVTADFNQYKSARYFASLDGLRFICIFAVLWHHSPAYGTLSDPIQLLNRGFTGVDFFFVLSGYLITTLLLREEERHGRFSISGFYWRRVLRILPVYYLVVTLCAVYWIWVKGQAEYAPLVPYYYLFLSNILIDDIPLLAPTWSLSVEEQYYLIWPALLLLLPVGWRVRAWVLVFLILICVLSASGALAWMGLRPIETEVAIWTLPTNSYTAILLGSLAAVLLHIPAGYAVLHRIFAQRWVPLLVLVVVLAVLQFTPARLIGWPMLLVHGAMTCFIISIVVREDHVLRPVLSARPVARMGEISYGLYLYHLIGLHFANEIGDRIAFGDTLQPWAVTALFVLFSILISEISFRTYEAYFLGLKNKAPWRRSQAAK